MKKCIFLLLAAILVACGHNSQKEEVTKDYYLVSVGGKSDIKKLHSYENDSIALAEELQRSNDYDEFCMDSIAKYMQMKAKAGTGTMEYYTANAKIGAYSSILEEVRILMRISHTSDYDPSEFIDVVTKNGVYSEETRQYIETNKINVEFYRIKG